MTTKLTDKNISNVANLGIQWQAVITADGSTATTAVAGRGYLIDTTSNAHTINLPASAIAGDTIAIKDYAATFGTNALTISRNGSNIQGVANDSQISTNRASVELIYVDSTKGWVYTNESNVADLEGPTFIEATGGTIATSGDFKIHTFTGDGCFVVSCAGLGTPTFPSIVDYLVVAGGGGGGNSTASGGGGGAGGLRFSATTYCSPSPLKAPAGLTVSATTYPITVGGGGAGGPPGNEPGAQGSNSVFSTITSTGGGGGGGGIEPQGQPYRDGQPGGSGGGGTYGPGPGSAPDSIGGTGNTPPTSPPQGNNGGDGSPQCGAHGGGGGGGFTAVGAVGTTTAGGNGGAGITLCIAASPNSYGGGGGGGIQTGNPDEAGSGGTGGGGGGGKNAGGVQSGGSGTGNTGGGGGGSGPACGGNGGKGIIIIRYKYQ